MNPTEVKVPTREEVATAIATLLKVGMGIDLEADLSIFRTEDFYVVNYIGSEPLPNMDIPQRQEFRKEGEMSEYCETPEEAAEVFLKLKEKREN